MPPEQSPSPTPQPEPYKFNFWETNPKKNFAPWFLKFCVVLIIIGLGTAGYLKYQAYQIYKSSVPEMGSSYVNNLFGFSIELPESWAGYTVNHIKGDIRDITGKTTNNNGVVDSYQLIELHHPTESATNLREVMPIMIFTPTQWQHILKEEWSVGAAPMPPSLLGQNSQWILALPARYNYDYKPGWEEVDKLVHTLKAFEPSAETSTWQTYRNEEYGFEFSYQNDWKKIEQSRLDFIHLEKDSLNSNSCNLTFIPAEKDPEEKIKDILIEFNSKSNLQDKIIDSREGIENIFASETSNGHTVYLPLTNTIFLVISITAKKPDYIKCEAEFDQILSTFKFIESEAQTTGTLTGKVTIGPNCPVEQVGNPCSTPPEAYAVREFLVLDSKQKQMATFHADGNGNFNLTLAPGTYTVVSAKTGMGFVSGDLPKTITIKSGQTIMLNIDIDTGIR